MLGFGVSYIRDLTVYKCNLQTHVTDEAHEQLLRNCYQVNTTEHLPSLASDELIYIVSDDGLFPDNTNQLTHLPLDKTASISQKILSDAFSWMKIEKFQIWLKFRWGLFLRVQMTITQH